MADYPSSIWAGNTRGSNLSDAETHTTWHDEIMAEAIAIETALGTSPVRTLKAIAAEFPAASSSWTTPFTGGVTTAGGTFTRAQYYQIGRLVFCELDFVGSGAFITGAVTVDLPVDLAASHRAIMSHVVFQDQSAVLLVQGNCSTVGAGSTATALKVINVAGTYSSIVDLSATIPFTWASNDRIVINLAYLA